ncbi:DNA polymerase III subunit gamma/tau [Acidobacteriia bacterium AH_259_A11_L15]|nr:DNA polymerase III subunit gamma/tau [Acidobacteriia bacterium AH_259_A11_L15]
MTYQVIARKYRPQTFDEIIGQEPIVRTLKNAIKQNLVAHAYIFSGTRGVGKTTTARILAKALNCQKGPTTTPCGQCPPCQEIAAASSIDVLEVDAASTGRVEEIRELLENARYLPARDPYKVFLIDEAHMLTTPACNALLKTLEEPPARVMFILATTEPHKIIPTIHSRCQSFHFRTISFQEILAVLERVARQEKTKVEPEALAVMARAAEGSLRDALSVLDQALAYCGTSIAGLQVRELLGVVEAEVLDAFIDAIATQSSEKMLRLVDSLVRDGHNLQYFCKEALRHIRNLLLVRIGGSAAELAEAAGQERRQLEQAARQFSEEDLLRFFNVLLKVHKEMHLSPHPRLHLELALLKLVQAERLVPLEEVLAELTNSPGAAAPVPGRQSPKSNPAAAAAARPRATPPAPAGSSLPAETIAHIQQEVHARSKFLGSLVDQVLQWEPEKGALKLWFAPENRTLVDMLGRKQHQELEGIVSQVLGEPVKVYPKVGAAVAAPAHPTAERQEKHPVVQALLERFGGTVRTASDLPDRQAGLPERQAGLPERQAGLPDPEE